MLSKLQLAEHLSPTRKNGLFHMVQRIRELAEAIALTVGFEGELVFDTGRPDGPPVKWLDSAPLRALAVDCRTKAPVWDGSAAPAAPEAPGQTSGRTERDGGVDSPLSQSWALLDPSGSQENPLGSREELRAKKPSEEREFHLDGMPKRALQGPQRGRPGQARCENPSKP